MIFLCWIPRFLLSRQLSILSHNNRLTTVHQPDLLLGGFISTLTSKLLPHRPSSTSVIRPNRIFFYMPIALIRKLVVKWFSISSLFTDEDFLHRPLGKHFSLRTFIILIETISFALEWTGIFDERDAWSAQNPSTMEKKKAKQKENARKSLERLMKHVNFSPIRQQLCIHAHRLLSIVMGSVGVWQVQGSINITDERTSVLSSVCARLFSSTATDRCKFRMFMKIYSSSTVSMYF